ncbi:protein kinase-like domain, concanavalin A-like lectin/glucanase domain protein [Tanacetum coccineum]
MGDENPILHSWWNISILATRSYENPSELRREQRASNWLERLPAGSITTWEDLTTRFLAQFFPPRRTAKLRNDILMFQQHHGEFLSEAWTHEAGWEVAITYRIAGTLPSYTVKNPKLSTSPVLSARSYPTIDPKCSTLVHGSINTIMITSPKQQNDSSDNMTEEEKQEREGSNKDDEGIECLEVEEPLDLVDTSKESVYESLIKEMPKCSLHYDFRIKKGDPRNLKIPCMIGCRKPSDLEDGFYRDVIKLGPEYATEMDDEGEVAYGCVTSSVATRLVIYDEKKLGSS